MVAKIQRANREYTQRNKINDAIDALNTAIDQLQNVTASSGITTFSGDVGINIDTPDGIFHIVDEDGDTITFDRISANASGLVINVRKARGTKASPATVNAGDNVFICKIKAHDGTSYDNVGDIRVIAESVSSGNISGKLQLQLADTAGTLQTRLTIDENGYISGSLPTSSIGLPTGTWWNDSGTIKVA